MDCGFPGRFFHRLGTPREKALCHQPSHWTMDNKGGAGKNFCSGLRVLEHIHMEGDNSVDTQVPRTLRALKLNANTSKLSLETNW